MHSVLLLDDVLRQILDLCPLPSLTAAARCCRAWNDPALDALWCYVCSLGPLIQLIDGVARVDGVYRVTSGQPLNLTRFNLYARRIKHIVQRHDIRLHPALLAELVESSSCTLPRLVTTRLSTTDALSLPAAFSLTPSLLHLDLDFGFKRKSRGSAGESSDHFLVALPKAAPHIARLRLRGNLPQPIDLARMSDLTSLTLRVGTSLSPEILESVFLLPRLLELDMDAAHLDPGRTRQSGRLPLRSLAVRASAGFLEDFLRFVSEEHMKHIRLELTALSSWSDIFDALAFPALEELTIEHDLEDVDAELPSPDCPRQHPTLDAMRRLASLRHLRRLVLDFTYFPLLSDTDIEMAASWWPRLVHLDLGCATDCASKRISGPLATPACLRSFALKMTALERLVMPLCFSGGALEVPEASTNSKLAQATLTSPQPPADPQALGDYLRRLFPSLEQVDGFDEQENSWKLLAALL
ncbi:unnamed protein product [Mycena citricolor]|uniref:F-box domain-containing protein n=1 Tax=Mycena citricolor TaxID=2018698 RepID=A0AAD2H1E8_9AGAR|nr:unnamed protein product [Mycena citricolor]